MCTFILYGSFGIDFHTKYKKKKNTILSSSNFHLEQQQITRTRHKKFASL